MTGRHRRIVRYNAGQMIMHCSACKEWFGVDDFYKNGFYADGQQRYHMKCKACSEADKRANRNRKEDSKCWICKDLDECKALLHALVDVGDHYEPAPLPCYEEKIGVIV